MTRKSTGVYPDNWKEIAKAIKDENEWKCVRCQHPHEPKAGYTLTIHHADINPSNSRWWNLLCLCQRCHLQIQHKVILERPWFLPHSEWFRPFVAGYYAYCQGLPDDKEYVMAHIEELLALGQAA
jgi:5-methylcytosine-specific restriction endonuclease McrA